MLHAHQSPPLGTSHVSSVLGQCTYMHTMNMYLCTQLHTNSFPFSCCCARSQQLPSCTTSIPTSAYPTSAGNFCPAPPKLSFPPGSTPQGPLQDKATFVAEHLLSLSTQEGPTVFFNRFQGGFVVSPRDPAFSVCSAPTPATTCPIIQKVSTVLQDVTCMEEDLAYSLDLSLSNLTCACSRNISSLTTCLPPFCTANGLPTLSSCYAMDGNPSACLQGLSCFGSGCGTTQGSGRPVSATYPPQDSNVSITVWYNNQV